MFVCLPNAQCYNIQLKSGQSNRIQLSMWAQFHKALQCPLHLWLKWLQVASATMTLLNSSLITVRRTMFMVVKMFMRYYMAMFIVLVLNEKCSVDQ